MFNKRGQEGVWTVRKVVILILLVIILILVVFGFLTGKLKPLYESVSGKMNSVLILFGYEFDGISSAGDCYVISSDNLAYSPEISLIIGKDSDYSFEVCPDGYCKIKGHMGEELDDFRFCYLYDKRGFGNCEEYSFLNHFEDYDDSNYESLIATRDYYFQFGDFVFDSLKNKKGYDDFYDIFNVANKGEKVAACDDYFVEIWNSYVYSPIGGSKIDVSMKWCEGKWYYTKKDENGASIISTYFDDSDSVKYKKYWNDFCKTVTDGFSDEVYYRFKILEVISEQKPIGDMFDIGAGETELSYEECVVLDNSKENGFLHGYIDRMIESVLKDVPNHEFEEGGVYYDLFDEEVFSLKVINDDFFDSNFVYSDSDEYGSLIDYNVSIEKFEKSFGSEYFLSYPIIVFSPIDSEEKMIYGIGITKPEYTGDYDKVFDSRHMIFLYKGNEDAFWKNYNEVDMDEDSSLEESDEVDSDDSSWEKYPEMNYKVKEKGFYYDMYLGNNILPRVMDKNCRI